MMMMAVKVISHPRLQFVVIKFIVGILHEVVSLIR